MLVGHRGLVGLFINKFIRCQGLRVRIPSPTISFERRMYRIEENEECIVRWKKKNQTCKQYESIIQ